VVFAESKYLAESNAHADEHERVSDQKTDAQSQSTGQDEQKADDPITKNATETFVEDFAAHKEGFRQLQTQSTVFKVNGDGVAAKIKAGFSNRNNMVIIGFNPYKSIRHLP